MLDTKENHEYHHLHQDQHHDRHRCRRQHNWTMDCTRYFVVPNALFLSVIFTAVYKIYTMVIYPQKREIVFNVPLPTVTVPSCITTQNVIARTPYSLSHSIMPNVAWHNISKYIHLDQPPMPWFYAHKTRISRIMALTWIIGVYATIWMDW